MAIIFASDIHLSESRPDISESFIRFLQQQCSNADVVYLLGDIFEYWLGDDVSLPVYKRECAALHELTQSGVSVFAQVGNRDFALGKEFESTTGVKLLPDIKIIDVYDTPCLICHGDDLCTDDKQYQRLRALLRNRVILGLLRKSPIRFRQKLADKIRQKSAQQKQSKSAVIMDVNAAAVKHRFNQYAVKTMIHGHTHRPNIHIDDAFRRIVLGDWYEQGSMLRVEKKQAPNEWQLSNLPLADITGA